MSTAPHPLSFLLPPTYKSQITAWLDEDCPSFDYGGYVVGERDGEARLLGKSRGIVAGVPFFDEVFAQLGCRCVSLLLCFLFLFLFESLKIWAARNFMGEEEEGTEGGKGESWRGESIGEEEEEILLTFARVGESSGMWLKARCSNPSSMWLLLGAR